MASDPAEEHLRSPDVWFEDGTLVVRAETTVFRVYRGILASQSEVFKDMLAFPQPDDPEAEAFDGCPVVRVQDSAEDMSCFLRVLHDTNYFYRQCEYDVSHISALLRLATKYDTQELRARVVGRLSQIFPTSRCYDEYALAQPRRLHFDTSDTIVLCNLADQLQLNRLSVSLTYSCAVDLSPQVIMEGRRVDDKLIELNAWLKRSVLKVRMSIVAEMDTLFEPWMYHDLDETMARQCSDFDTCRRRCKFLKSTLSPLDWQMRLNVPPWRFGDLADVSSKAKGFDRDSYHWASLSDHVGFCVVCTSAFATKYERMQYRIWAFLPTWVGTSATPWDELRDW